MREMKDSGIEWIHDIPVSWTVMPNKYLMHKIKTNPPRLWWGRHFVFDYERRDCPRFRCRRENADFF